jgi:hypothetical protein
VRIPYVVGQWVRGDRFYGRGSQLDEILRGPRDRLRVVGTRRVGKTSLLRQAELLALSDPDSAMLPLLWDLQGVENATDLALSFQDALLDAEQRLAEVSVELPDVTAIGLADAIAGLAGQLAARHRSLLLLCDETEDLAAVLATGNQTACSAWRGVADLATVRIVLASSTRLEALASKSPAGVALLDEMAEPLHLGPLSDGEARALLRQEQLPVASRPELDEPTVDAICRQCGGHPFLLQLLAKRTLELDDVTAACAGLAADPMVDYLLAADLALLDERDRERLQGVARGEELLASDDAGATKLQKLGLLRRDETGRLTPGNVFLTRSLAARDAVRS